MFQQQQQQGPQPYQPRYGGPAQPPQQPPQQYGPPPGTGYQATPKYVPMATGIQIYHNANKAAQQQPAGPQTNAPMPLQPQVNRPNETREIQMPPAQYYQPVQQPQVQVQQQQQVDVQALIKGVDRLKKENEKMQLKADYLENFIGNMMNFEQTQNIGNLKAFLIANSKKFENLLDEIYKIKESYEIEKLENEDLAKKYEELKGHIKGMSGDLASQDKGSLLAQMKSLENNIEFLTKEAAELNTKNAQMVDKLSKKDFFREYEYMNKESEGLKKQNSQISEEIKKIQEELEKRRKK